MAPTSRVRAPPVRSSVRSSGGDDRGAAPPLALLLAVGVIVGVAAGGVAIARLDEAAAASDATLEAGALSVDLRANAATGEVTLLHRGGPAIDARELRVVVTVDGTALERQPPVPFFATAGFRGGPTGPFNPAADPLWTVGERAGFRLASTNSPELAEGRQVTVRLSSGGEVLATARTEISGRADVPVQKWTGRSRVDGDEDGPFSRTPRGPRRG